MSIWQVAKEKVDVEISELQSALRDTNLPLGRRIADGGLHGLSQSLQVGLQAALIDFDNATGEARHGAAAKLAMAVKNSSAFLLEPSAAVHGEGIRLG